MHTHSVSQSGSQSVSLNDTHSLDYSPHSMQTFKLRAERLNGTIGPCLQCEYTYFDDETNERMEMEMNLHFRNSVHANEV